MIALELTTGLVSSAPMTLSVTVNGVEYADPLKNASGASIAFDSIQISEDIRGNARASFDIIDKTGALGALPMWCDVAIWDGYTSLLVDNGRLTSDQINALPFSNEYLFRGVMVHQTQVPAYGIGQRIHCECVDWGIFLDRSFIPSLSYTGGGSTADALGIVGQAGGVPWPIWWSHYDAQTGSEVQGQLVSNGDTGRSLFDLMCRAMFLASTDYWLWIASDGEMAISTSAAVNDWGDMKLNAVGTAATPSYAPRYLITDAVTAGPDSYCQLVWDTPGLVGYWRLDESVVAAPGAINRVGVTAYRRHFGQNGRTRVWGLDSALDTGVYTGAGFGLVQKQGLIMAGEPKLGCPSFVAASTQYVTVPNSPRIALGDTVSFECWVARSTATAQGIMNLGAGSLAVTWNADGSISGQKAGTGDFMKSTTTIPSDSSFHHVVVVKSPGAAAIYIDGVSVGGVYTAQTLSVSASALELARQSGGVNYLNGWLSNCALYGVALTAQQVISHWQARTVQIGTITGDFSSGIETDGTQEESAVWNGTRFVYVDEAVGADRGVQSAYRQLASAALQPGISATSYLAPKQTRIRGQVTVTSRDYWQLGQQVQVTNKALGLTALAMTVYQIDIKFINGLGERKTTLGLGTLGALGSRPSASRQLQARLSKANL